MSEIAELKSMVVKLSEGMAAQQKSLAAVQERMKATPAAGPKASDVFGVPWARNGEDPLTSRGFSFMKALGVLTRAVPREQAKVEMDIAERLDGTLGNAKRGVLGYEYAANGETGQHRLLAPLSTAYLQEDFVDRNFRHEIKSLVRAGSYGYDPDEAMWIRQQQFKALGYGQKTLSWLTENLGGALVAPPEMGELIELLRNKEALINAGARTVPLPPQGRMVFPRQTGASLTYWVGENAPITASDLQTGQIVLQAKKLTVLIKAPNELIRFASPAAEALMRDDMTKSLALGLDFAGLEGAGGDHRPRGILNYPGITRITSSSPGDANTGDRVMGQDVYRMIAAVEEANAEFEGFIMRPKTLYKFYQLRADAVGQADSAGPFLFSLVREAGDGVKPKLGGFDVTTSTQVSQARTKGTASNLTYIIGGMWSDVLIGMFGAIEFAATTMGDTPFVNDQTWVRGILSADIQVRHEAAFSLVDKLDTLL